VSNNILCYNTGDMPYKTGVWGEQAKMRSKERLEYFRLKLHARRVLKDTIGHKGELFAERILENSKLVNKIYDIEWGDKKVEVKTAMLRSIIVRDKYGSYIFKNWRFNIRRQHGIADYFFLVCLNEVKEVIAAYFIPAHVMPAHDVRLGINRSRYSQYLIKRGDDK
jgi:hypothetical protein